MNAYEEINKLVADGVITQEEADRLFEAMKEGETSSGRDEAPFGGADAAQTGAQEEQAEQPHEAAAEGQPAGTADSAPPFQGAGQNLRVKVDVGKIRILPAEDGRISYRVDLHGRTGRLEDYDYGMREEGATLLIYLRSRLWRKRMSHGNLTLFVYVPRDGLGRLSVKNDVGDCHIERVSADSIDIRCDVGKLEIEKVRMREGDFRTDVGKIEYGRGNRVSDRLSLRSDVGNLSVMMPAQGDYQITYKTDVGSLQGDLSRDVLVNRQKIDFVGERGTLTCGAGTCRIDCRVATGSLILNRE